jgi:hypothetical protein
MDQVSQVSQNAESIIGKREQTKNLNIFLFVILNMHPNVLSMIKKDFIKIRVVNRINVA